MGSTEFRFDMLCLFKHAKDIEPISKIREGEAGTEGENLVDIGNQERVDVCAAWIDSTRHLR